MCPTAADDGVRRLAIPIRGRGRYTGESRMAPDWEAEGGYLPPWDLSVRVALTIAGAVGSAARFDWVRIESASPRE